MLTETQRNIIAHECGAIASVTLLAEGHNAYAYRIHTHQSEDLVAKVSTDGGDLSLEAWMLTYLADHSNLPVPSVLYAEPSWFLMHYVPASGLLSASGEEEGAELLAALHRVHADQFGLERDTLIGPLHQPNMPCDDWREFFSKHRLIYMAEQAHQEGALSVSTLKKCYELAERIGEYLDENVLPSLIHGDVWGGNVLTCEGRISGFIDPAIYYADPEIELAFITMFQTFSDAFFRRYHDIKPIHDGFWELRRDLYLLYPLLVHVRIYRSAHYHRQVDAILRRMVG